MDCSVQAHLVMGKKAKGSFIEPRGVSQPPHEGGLPVLFQSKRILPIQALGLRHFQSLYGCEWSNECVSSMSCIPCQASLVFWDNVSVRFLSKSRNCFSFQTPTDTFICHLARSSWDLDPASIDVPQEIAEYGGISLLPWKAAIPRTLHTLAGDINTLSICRSQRWHWWRNWTQVILDSLETARREAQDKWATSSSPAWLVIPKQSCQQSRQVMCAHASPED